MTHSAPAKRLAFVSYARAIAAASKALAALQALVQQNTWQVGVDEYQTINIHVAPEGKGAEPSAWERAYWMPSVLGLLRVETDAFGGFHFALPAGAVGHVDLTARMRGYETRTALAAPGAGELQLPHGAGPLSRRGAYLSFIPSSRARSTLARACLTAAMSRPCPSASTMKRSPTMRA